MAKIIPHTLTFELLLSASHAASCIIIFFFFRPDKSTLGKLGRVHGNRHHRVYVRSKLVSWWIVEPLATIRNRKLIKIQTTSVQSASSMECQKTSSPYNSTFEAHERNGVRYSGSALCVQHRSWFTLFCRFIWLFSRRHYSTENLEWFL